jgi:hypothetical protein
MRHLVGRSPRLGLIFSGETLMSQGKKSLGWEGTLCVAPETR